MEENLNETEERISEKCDSENERNFETPNFDSEIEENFETPNENSWVPIHSSDRFLVDFDGFKSKEPSKIDKYRNKYRKMVQELPEDLILELKDPYDSDLDLDLDFDIDFSGFTSDDGEKLQNILNENKENEEKENPDLPPPNEDEIYNFNSHLSPSEHLQLEGCSSWGHTHKKKAEEEERLEDEQHSNAQEFKWNPETCTSYGHSYSEVEKSVTQTHLVKHFRCIKVNCPSVIIVYEDPDEDNENEYLFSVKECKYHQ